MKQTASQSFLQKTKSISYSQNAMGFMPNFRSNIPIKKQDIWLESESSQILDYTIWVMTFEMRTDAVVIYTALGLTDKKSGKKTPTENKKMKKNRRRKIRTEWSEERRKASSHCKATSPFSIWHNGKKSESCCVCGLASFFFYVRCFFDKFSRLLEERRCWSSYSVRSNAIAATRPTPLPQRCF